MTQRLDRRSTVELAIVLALVFLAWRLEFPAMARELIFNRLGTYNMGMAITLLYVGVGLVYALKLRRLNMQPPPRTFQLLGPMDIPLDNLGRGLLAWGCLRGLEILLYVDLQMTALDKATAVAPLFVVLFLTARSVSRDAMQVLALGHAAATTTASQVEAVGET